MTLPSKQELIDARSRISHWVHKTPVLTSSTFNTLTGAEVFFKCENFQRMGAYKMRGALHAIMRLDEEARSKGVVTHSSGNFASGIAFAGMSFGKRVIVVMPQSAPRIKFERTRSFGAGECPGCKSGSGEKLRS